MRHTPLPAMLLTLAALILPGAARAWGDQGHQVIGLLAYERLSAPARAAVDALLAQDTDMLSAPDFASRTTWADKYRDSDRIGGQKHYKATRQWHFANIEVDGGSLDEACHGRPPLPAGVAASAGPATACVVDKLAQFQRELADPATPAGERLLALKFLLHFIGDLHQPLHMANRQDSGGNEVPVRVSTQRTLSNLHAYWDTHLVRRLGTSPAKAAAQVGRHITPQQAEAWAQGTIDQWALDTHAQAGATAYALHDQQGFSDDEGRAGHVLDRQYEGRALPVVRESLAKAAVRLAQLLNQALR